MEPFPSIFYMGPGLTLQTLVTSATAPVIRAGRAIWKNRSHHGEGPRVYCWKGRAGDNGRGAVSKTLN